MKMFLNIKLSKIFINLLIFLFFTLCSFLVCEIIIRNTLIFEKFGFQSPLSLKERIEKHTKLDQFNNKNIIIIGDSNVEYMRGSKHNFLEIAEKSLENNFNIKLLNFGFGGAGIKDYILIFKKLNQEEIQFKDVFFFIDNHNDYFDYYYYIKNDLTGSEMSDEKVFDKLDFSIKKFLKKSVFINAIYRNILKRYFKIGYGKSLDNNINHLKKIFNVDENLIRKRLEKIPQNYVKLSKADIISSWWLSFALTLPEMKLLDHFGYKEKKEEVSIAIANDINTINSMCGQFNKNCHLFFLPDQVTLNKKYHKLYESLNFELNDNMSSINYHEKLIADLLKNEKIKVNSLFLTFLDKNDIYIDLDTHLNFYGNKILSKYIENYIINSVH